MGGSCVGQVGWRIFIVPSVIVVVVVVVLIVIVIVLEVDHLLAIIKDDMSRCPLENDLTLDGGLAFIFSHFVDPIHYISGHGQHSPLSPA